jgi:tetratricopeptide (TPR) repeat protein
MKNIIVFLILSLVVISSDLNAQKMPFEKYNKQHEKTSFRLGKKQFLAGNYSTAYHHLIQAYQKHPNSQKVNYFLSQCALKVRNYSQALTSFEALGATSSYRKKIKALYPLLLKHNQKYEEALRLFELLKEETKDPIALPEIEQHINACTNAIYFKGIYSNTTLKNKTRLNSASDELAITKSQQTKQTIVTCWNENGLGTKLIDSTYKSQSLLNDVQEFHLAPNGTTVYFVKNELINNQEFQNIYRGTLAQNKVINIQKLNNAVNAEASNSRSPHIAIEENGQELLYFSSDRVGGEGRLDIWCAPLLSNGQFGLAFNLGSKVNSPYDEVNPSYHSTGNTLYYSSDKPLSIGGFDVFKTQGSKRNWTKPKQLPIPYNSNADDLYFVLGPMEFYISSNRAETTPGLFSTATNDFFEVIKP